MKVLVKKGNEFIEVIERKPIAKIIGNFNPHWIRYKNKQYLIQGGIDYAYMHGDNPEGVEYYIDIDK